MRRIQILVSLVLAFSMLVAEWGHAQFESPFPSQRSRRFPSSTESRDWTSPGGRTPEMITWTAQLAVRDPRLLEQALPELVDSLLDDDSRVRASAARGLGATAIKLERLAFARSKTPAWESLASHYEQALLRLNSQPKLLRYRRQIEQLVGRFGDSQEKIIPPSTLAPSEPDFLTRFFDAWDENDLSRIAESWIVLQRLLDEHSMEQQKVIWSELVETSSAKFLQYVLTVSDRCDDAIIQCILEGEAVSSLPDAFRILELATPSQEQTTSKLLSFCVDPSNEMRLRLAALQSLSHASEVDSVWDSIAKAILHGSSDMWASQAWDRLCKHKNTLSPETISEVKRYWMQSLQDEALSSDDQGVAAKRLYQWDGLDPMVRGLIGNVLARQIASPDQVSSDLLAAIQAMIDSDRLADDPVVLDSLFRLVNHEDEKLRSLALQSLRNASEIPEKNLNQLISIIADRDEESSVKVLASRIIACQKNAPLNVLNDKLAEHMRRSEEDRCIVDLLRVIEAIGVSHEVSDELCFQIARDSSFPLDERIAAWHARAQTASPSDALTHQVLTVLRKSSESIENKAAALVTLASVMGECTVPVLQEYSNGQEFLLQCTARFSHHLVGDSETAARLLIELVPTADSPEWIESLLKEMGDSARGLLWQVVEAPLVSDDQRMMAYRVLVHTKPVEWERMLGYVANDDRGELFSTELLRAWEYDDSIVPALFAKIATLPSDSQASLRYWQLVDSVTGELGGGSDTNEWGDSPLRQGIASRVAPRKKWASEPTAVAQAELAVPTAESMASQASPTAPVADVVPQLQSQTKQTVDVFYATNRQLRPIANLGTGLKWLAFGIAIVCIFVCLIAFARQRSFAYAFVSLVGLLGLTALARESLDMNYWFPDRVAIYTGEYSDQVKLGVCQVTIPENHAPGELESPSFLLRWEVKPDPEKHIVLASTEPLDHNTFYSKLQTNMKKSGRNLLVFVHGYNVSFEDAARRTAQMTVDLKFPGAPVFYSWPSYSNWYRYPDDATNIQRSVAQIRGFLQQLARESDADSINLVAHSMGNVGLTQALAGLESQTPIFNQVVLAAPDIDADVFRKEIAPQLKNKARRITLYTSQTDLALLASRYFNSGDRVGDSSRGVVVVDGIETIDATSIDSSLLGHSYYGSNVNVLDDIANLLHNKPITDRGYLEFRSESSPPFWSFSSEIRAANAASSTTR